MEGVINSTIKQHLLSNNLLSDAQYGFRQDHSAPDFITTLIQTRTKELGSRVACHSCKGEGLQLPIIVSWALSVDVVGRVGPA
eukprot:g44453.t1